MPIDDNIIVIVVLSMVNRRVVSRSATVVFTARHRKRVRHWAFHERLIVLNDLDGLRRWSALVVLCGGVNMNHVNEAAVMAPVANTIEVIVGTVGQRTAVLVTELAPLCSEYELAADNVHWRPIVGSKHVEHFAWGQPLVIAKGFVAPRVADVDRVLLGVGDVGVDELATIPFGARTPCEVAAFYPA